MPTKEEVYGVLNEELEYQKKVFGDVDHKNKPKNYVKYMKSYLAHVSDALKLDKVDVAMDNFRKVTALGIAAMLNYGAVRRGQTSDPSSVEQKQKDKTTLNVPVMQVYNDAKE